MKKFILLLTVLVSAVFVSCSGSDSDSSLMLKKGTYNYTLTDSSGASLVEGVMKIDSIVPAKGNGKTSYNVHGSYTVSKMTQDTSYHGFATMNGGAFTGFYDDSQKSIGINTNPKIADANVFWQANVTSKELKGYWYFSTFRGSDKEGGYFKAVKK